jgi:hypothetical protein
VRLPRFRIPPPVITPVHYVRKDGPAGRYVEHLHGVDWDDAPQPPRRHACWPQSRAVLGGGMRAERCACGAYRDELGPWIDRNTRMPRTLAERAEHERRRAVDRLIREYEAADQAHDVGAMADIRAHVAELIDDSPEG